MSEALEFTIEIAATRETVYAFLTDPALFQQWMGATSEMTAGSHGSFVVRYPTGDEAVGEVVEAVPPARVVYTWGYRDGRYGLGPGGSRVIIELTVVPAGTRLSLRHEGLPSEPVRTAHEQGWRYYFGLLSARAVDRQTAQTVGAALAAWTRAWNGADEAALARGCTEDVIYVDRLASVRGRDALLRHIKNARAFAPSVRLEVTGAPSITQSFARFDWRMDANGQSLGSGLAVGELSLDGQFVRVVSFWS
jgi:uncharacterized protein YndB with AHSA1/START domain